MGECRALDIGITSARHRGGAAGEVGASFHPGDHALALSAFAVVEIPVSFDGAVDGASLAVNARCDEGSSLRFEGNGVVTLAGGESLVSDSPGWRRRTWELSRATRLLQVPLRGSARGHPRHATARYRALHWRPTPAAVDAP